MTNKLFLSDFDGTLVSKDILDVICGIVGKETESKRLNEEFIAGKREGLPTLKQRIDFLKGVGSRAISDVLRNQPFLIAGAKQLFDYLKGKGYVTVLHSGNILPVLGYYQNLLGIDHIVGTKPRMDGDTILGIELEDFGSRTFKADGCNAIIESLGVHVDHIVAIGDSPADLGIFGLAGTRIAINPKGGIEAEADYVVENDLRDVITFLESKFPTSR